ncbi:Hypothetical predicted protein [Marmota monax]|uniref:Protein phosphatase 1L-like n=1 Tax=Marmota monax TaxID=9995 RepID=A0A5E4CDK0_MARMO|nr:protein phosphatase 1L-like [Marmota monax]VTJ79923.1 Hypothetical predicted protein [Marmota monax]
MIEDTMTLLSLLGRIMRYFLLRPETLFLLCISLALWSYFFHTDEVKTIVKSSRDAVKMVKGKVAEIMQNDRLGGLDVLEAEFSKTWEFKSHNVAVYSIQGRRDHMEDRFEVLTDLANKTHPSIFGIFDGHGGETAAEYVKSRLPEALKQHLQDYEKDKENSVLSYQTILEQQILSIDREMLEKLTVSYDEAGEGICLQHEEQMLKMDLWRAGKCILVDEDEDVGISTKVKVNISHNLPPTNFSFCWNNFPLFQTVQKYS